MVKKSKARIAVFASALILAVTVAVSAAAPCAKLTVAVNPTIAQPGQTVVVTGSINNCSAATEKVTVTYSASGPCGFSEMGSVKLTLKPGETRTSSMSYTAPTCAGDYTITGTANSGGADIDTASTVLTVQ
jgi:hypothetical protein